jgi:hypothetical protein
VDVLVNAPLARLLIKKPVPVLPIAEKEPQERFI